MYDARFIGRLELKGNQMFIVVTRSANHIIVVKTSFIKGAIAIPELTTVVVRELEIKCISTRTCYHA